MDAEFIRVDYDARRPKMKLFHESMPFYKGNLHTHTTLSDGRKTPEGIMAEYAQHGYDFLALTDHWHVGAERRFGDMLVLPGVEYDFTFATQLLHVVALFPDAACGEKIVRGMSHGEVIRIINDCGGIPIAAHPAWSLNTPDFLKSLDGIELAEVYNTISDEPTNAPRGNSSQILDVTAANGKLFKHVAADDTHSHQNESCQSYIMLQTPALTVQDVLDSLRAGRFYATQGPEFLDVELTEDALIVRTSPVSRCTFCSNAYWVDGRCRTGEGMTENVYKLQPGERFVRCELVDDQGRRAWLSPLDLTQME